MNGITELDKKMEKLEENINFLKRQTDDILSNISINKNILGNIHDNSELFKGDEK